MTEAPALVGSFLSPEGLPPATGGLAPVFAWTPQHAPSAQLLGVARAIEAAGGRALLVGGWVRDALRGGAPRDEDVEVFGLSPEQAVRALRRGHAVGADFGILKVGQIDVSFPRGRRRPGAGAQGLQDDAEPHLPLAEAAKRRDFSINALVWDPLNHALYDPTEGLADLSAGVLRHVCSAGLVEDPIRVMRAAQLVARLGLRLETHTEVLLRELSPELVRMPQERVFKELETLLMRAVFVEAGWRVARGLGVVATLWPELEALPAPRWQQVMASLRALSRAPSPLPGSELAVRLVVLGHGLSLPVFSDWLSRVCRQTALLKACPPLARHWRAVDALAHAGALPGDLGRLALAAPLADQLRLAAALRAAEPSAARFAALRGQAQRLGLLAGPAPALVQGRDLLAAGHGQGPQLGALIKRLYLAQLDGRFSSLAEGLALAQRLSAGGR